MKQLLICLLAAFTFAACSDDENINITPTERGTVTDDMGNVYEWVRIGDQDWTTSNACNGTPVWEAMYYNPDGGEKYHTDAYCDSVRSRYLPLTEIAYGTLARYPYTQLEPCSACKAPERPEVVRTWNAVIDQAYEELGMEAP